MLSSAVSVYPRTSFLSLGELSYILRESRILNHFTALLHGKYFKDQPLLSSQKAEMMTCNKELYPGRPMITISRDI